jgi:predicted DNA-binding transcriptional regulator YafY
MPTRTVATMISARFSVSRSTAYNEINTVSKQIDLSDDGPSIEESEAIFDQQALLASLQYQFDVSAAVGDTKSACQLVKAMDTIRKWSGRSMQSTEPTNHPFS